MNTTILAKAIKRNLIIFISILRFKLNESLSKLIYSIVNAQVMTFPLEKVFDAQMGKIE